LTLNGHNTFAGDTVIAQGTLALGAAGLLTNSAQITLSNNAALDVSSRSDGTLLIGNRKSLRGNGMVFGSVTAASGSTVAPGFSIGTVVVTHALILQAGSTNVMQLDAAAQTNDLISGMTSVSYGGRLVLTNVSGTLTSGHTFKLFSAGSYDNAFNSITWPLLGGNLVWTNRLGIDGTVGVVSLVNTSPTNITILIDGDTLQLSWPMDRTGWRLEAQTNTLDSGLGTNWVTVPESTTTNRLLLPISDVQGSVLYRLAYP